MLVLTHRAGDIIHIGDDIKIEVVFCEGRRVKLGFTAPKDVRILRDKVLKRLEASSDDSIQDH